MTIMSIIRKHEMIDVQNLIKKIKRKPKELWKTLRKLGAPSKEQSMSTISLKNSLCPLSL